MKPAIALPMLLAMVALHSNQAAAADISDLRRGALATFLTEVEIPAQHEFVVLYERDIENGDHAPRSLACQLHFAQSQQSRALKPGDAFEVVGGGWKEESLIPGQLPTRTAFLRLAKSNLPEFRFELQLKDSGDLSGQTNFDTALWTRRCRIAIEPA